MIFGVFGHRVLTVASLYPPRFGREKFSFWPTSKRRGVWARTVKPSLVPTVKWREYPLEEGAQGSIWTVSPKEKKSLEFGSISNVRTSSIISGSEQGEPRGWVEKTKTKTKPSCAVSEAATRTYPVIVEK